MSPERKSPAAGMEPSALSQAANEFIKLRDALWSIQDDKGEDQFEATLGTSEGVIETMHDRMSELARRIVDAPASTPSDLALKAIVALDWINDDGDLSDALSASVCRDLIGLFGEGNH
jgi:hypothetical protein